MSEKNFYVMLVDPSWAGPTADLISGPDVDTDDGEAIDEDDIDQPFVIKLVVDKQADDPAEFPPCDIHETPSHLLFSKKLIAVLQKLGIDNIEYFDANVTYEPTGKDMDYKVANIIGVIKGLDMGKSDVILSPRGNVLKIKKMHLDEVKLSGNRIFRLRESILHIIVHKSVKEAVEAAGLTGFLFVSDDKFKRSMI